MELLLLSELVSSRQSCMSLFEYIFEYIFKSNEKYLTSQQIVKQVVFISNFIKREVFMDPYIINWSWLFKLCLDGSILCN